MSGGKDRATLIGASAAACAACCAGPIIGFVAALGIGALAGALLFGTVGLAIAVAVGALLVARRQHRRHVPVPVALVASAGQKDGQ